jgi:hypothetical protein
MESEPLESGDELLTHCSWCYTPIAHNTIPAHLANLFCSRQCENAANFWLVQEMYEIEINYLPWSPDGSCENL